MTEMITSWMLAIIFLASGGLMCWLGVYLSKKAKAMAAHANFCEKLLNAFEQDIAQSPACCRSIAYLLDDRSRCECFRCRQQRGEKITEESQMQATALQERAARRFRSVVDGESRVGLSDPRQRTRT